MTYGEFKARIVRTLAASPEGMTWKELRDALELPYRTPCPEWVRRLEEEAGLERAEKRGRAFLWRITEYQ